MFEAFLVRAVLIRPFFSLVYFGGSSILFLFLFRLDAVSPVPTVNGRMTRGLDVGIQRGANRLPYFEPPPPPCTRKVENEKGKKSENAIER